MILFASIPAGNILGIPLRIHWSAPTGFFVFAVISWTHLNSWDPYAAFWRMVFPLTAIVIVAVQILVHELAHSLVAGIWGVRTDGIYLHVMGGLAMVSDPLARSLRPWQRMAIFAAGPGSNLVCFGAANLLAGVVHHWFASRMLVLIAGVNLGIAGFNLLPIWPLDGGKLFREFLALMRVPSRWADLLTLSLTLPVSIFCAWIAWKDGDFCAISVLILLMVIAVLVLWLLGIEPDAPMDSPEAGDASKTEGDPIENRVSAQS